MSIAVTKSPTRRRAWVEHPLSLLINVSWVLLILSFVAVSLLADAPRVAWVTLFGWCMINWVATIYVGTHLSVPLDAPRKSESDVVAEGTSLFRDAMHRLRRNQMATGSIVILLLLMLSCFLQVALFQLIPIIEGKDRTAFAPDSFYALHLDHTRTNEGQTYEPPNAQHWFGTDSLGRDLFARTLFGGSISFLVGIVGTVVSVSVGVSWGAVAGYFGGRVDEWMMRIVDILYGLPFLFLVILIMTLVNGLGNVASSTDQKFAEAAAAQKAGDVDKANAILAEITPDQRTASIVTKFMPPIVVVFVAIGLVSWLTMARITRGQVLSLKEREFVVAARAIGARAPRIIFRHIVPNLMGPVIVYSTLTIPEIMLSEAFLSFVGLGISEPNCSWGSLASEGLAGVNIIKPYWWLMVYPAAALSLSLFGLNFIGDGLRDALDPRSAK